MVTQVGHIDHTTRIDANTPVDPAETSLRTRSVNVITLVVPAGDAGQCSYDSGWGHLADTRTVVDNINVPSRVDRKRCWIGKHSIATDTVKNTGCAPVRRRTSQHGKGSARSQFHDSALRDKINIVGTINGYAGQIAQ